MQGCAALTADGSIEADQRQTQGGEPECPPNGSQGGTSQRAPDVLLPSADQPPVEELDTASNSALDARLLIAGAATSLKDYQKKWDHARELFTPLSRDEHSAPVGCAKNIIQETGRLRTLVSQTCPGWDDYMLDLGVGALYMYEKRLTDLSERDNVHLLWIVCGEKLLRAHNGQTWVYDVQYGYWSLFNGLLPQHMFDYIREYSLVLEGLFRSLSGTVPREDADVLKALRDATTGMTREQVIKSCASNCTWNKGNGLLAKSKGRGASAARWRRGAADAAPEDSEPGGPLPPQEPAFDDEDVKNVWYILTAQAIGRTCSSLRRRLEAGKVISYFTEWCDQPLERARGVAYKDCVILYDCGAENVSFQRRRSPGGNIYTGILRTLLDAVDPVLKAALLRLQKAYQETFWSITAAFEFGQACQAIAKRGMNVNCITVYWGPGGVGLTRYTDHIAAMYGEENHCMFDPNVFYDDTELRKQIEKMVGRIIYTGQEKPTNTRCGIRQDLVKKFATGEGIAGRMPYGIVTKLFKVVGWKRIELNKFLSFDDVTENNFESIMRRFAVIGIQARFFEAETFKALPGDRQKLGIFERDPELEGFIVSGPAVAAGHKLQYAFETEHGLDEGRQIIVHYTRGGGDNGIGEKYLRAACGLKPLDAVPAATQIPAGISTTDLDDVKTDDHMLRAASLFFAGIMNDRAWQFLTFSYYKQIPTSTSSFRLDISRSALWVGGSDSVSFGILL